MDLQNRVKELERLKACALCLDSSGNHQRDRCTAKTKGGEPFRSCSMLDSSGNKCSKNHNPWVHGGASSYVNLVVHSGSDTEVNEEENDDYINEDESTDSNETEDIIDSAENSTSLAQAGVAEIANLWMLLGLLS
jgi:hypothetical protein